VKIGRSRIWPFIIILVAAAGTLFVFFRMYQDDVKALTSFMASYRSFDRAVSVVPADKGLTSSAADSARKAAADLQVKGSLRLSSLIRHDAELMDAMREIAGLAQTELERLIACDSAVRNGIPDSEELSRDREALRGKRQAAYERFEQLGGLKEHPTR
jgi:hypothetical protein